MPVYEYACQECEGRFEYLQKVSEAPRERCERCGGRLTKLISNTSFVLKGGGWYKDGYGSGGSTAPEQKKKNPPAKTGDGATTETKPAPKATEPVGTAG